MGDLIDQLLALFTEADLRCRRGDTGASLPRLRAPMVALIPGPCRLEPLALDDYLGADADGAAHYGMLGRMELWLDIYVPHCDGPSRLGEYSRRCLQALAAGLEGARLEAVSLEQQRFDPDADCFCCRIRLYLARVCARVDA